MNRVESSTSPPREAPVHASNASEHGDALVRDPGRWMHAFAAGLFPICRSITGAGLRATLRRVQQEIPITIHEVPTGTPVLDWTIPDEWNIREGWIENARGERVVDFARNNLHVVNYSAPFRGRLTLEELQPHLHSLPEQPDWIPYRTTYYRRDWGFCLAHRQRQSLVEGDYQVCIDATLEPGSLSYGEWFLPGQTDDEFLISVHCCHPSLANDNLSGLAVAVALAKELAHAAGTTSGTPVGQMAAGTAAPLALASRTFRHSYRFLFIPGTIGAITWLARNEPRLARIQHGLVLTCVGDAGPVTYKKSRRSNAPIDRAVVEVLRDSGAAHRVIDFFPYGYDERQYCSPGFDLPVGCFMRSQHGRFPEYHTSADNLEFIQPAALADTLEKLWRVVEVVERADVKREDVNRESGGRVSTNAQPPPHGQRFLNLKPKGEPQLGKYGLYEALNGDVTPALWVLNFSDGAHSLAEIAARAALPFDNIARAADILLSRGLLKEVEP